MKKEASFFLLFFIVLSSVVYAQQSVADSASKEPVYILNAKNFYFKQINPTTELKILSGDVRLRQGTALFFCDSCVVNSSAHRYLFRLHAIPDQCKNCILQP
jgi:lipopolysaccharide export system protein LptA